MASKIDINDYPDTVAAFGGNEQRATVFLDRYSKKDDQGNPIEREPGNMWGRAAIQMSDQSEEDQWGRSTMQAPDYPDFFGILKDFKFVPGGRILAGSGTESEVTYYNCYVIPVETKGRRENRSNLVKWDYRPDDFPTDQLRSDPGSDSREAIFDTIGLMVDIMSRGGGVGINWSVLRPKGTHLKRVNGTTSGPVSWMDVASRAVGVVEQGGSRRGAAMFMIDDWHPDVLEFIEAKRNLGLITNANVSVCVSDAFMEAVKTDGKWQFIFPDTDDPAYNTDWDGDIGKWENNGHAIKQLGQISAREMWRKMAEAAWASGEPGVVFLDRYNKMSTAAGVERIISVNPCGEQGLGPYSVCNLGSMNLAAYVQDSNSPALRPFFNFPAFERDSRTATRFLDRVVDENYYFIPENEDIQKKLRRVGLGVMGLADALILLGLRYGSPEAVEFTESVYRSLKDSAIQESLSLAEEVGAAPGWQPSMVDRPYLAEYLSRYPEDRDQMLEFGMRNLFLLTQAPTGTTSILAGVNSGIEPYFAFWYTRKDRTGEHRIKAPILDQIGYDGSWSADYLVTSQDVTVEEHVAMQAAAQEYIDSSVSKTINGPNSHTVEDVEKAYTLAYDSGCKGVAYFRDGSGRDQVLYHDKPAVPETSDYDEAVGTLYEHFDWLTEFSRPTTLIGKTIKVRTIVGTAYITVNSTEDGRPIEVFINVGKAGSDIMELGEAIGRLASLALRKGATLGGVANQLEGIGGNGKFNKPLAHAIGEALTTLNTVTKVDHVLAEPVDPQSSSESTGSISTGEACPDCHNFSVVREENCSKCQLCGWSKC